MNSSARSILRPRGMGHDDMDRTSHESFGREGQFQTPAATQDERVCAYVAVLGMSLYLVDRWRGL